MSKQWAQARRRGLVALALLSAAALLSSFALPLYGAESKRDEVVERIVGCHAFSGGEKERQALEEAIEAVVQEFNILVRPIVRRKLEASNPVIERLCIHRNEGDLTIALDDRKYTAPLNGDEVTVTGITGDELRLHHQILGAAVRQIFVNDEAARINAYHPMKRERLQMRVRVYSEKLPKDLVYRLTYQQRQD